jgi:hypothetical protein
MPDVGAGSSDTVVEVCSSVPSVAMAGMIMKAECAVMRRKRLAMRLNRFIWPAE